MDQHNVENEEQGDNEADHLLQDPDVNDEIEISSLKYEKAVESCGFGKFQIMLLFICGWALASDSTEVQVCLYYF